jgi:hypothetical protein
LLPFSFPSMLSVFLPSILFLSFHFGSLAKEVAYMRLLPSPRVSLCPHVTTWVTLNGLP